MRTRQVRDLVKMYLRLNLPVVFCLTVYHLYFLTI